MEKTRPAAGLSLRRIVPPMDAVTVLTLFFVVLFFIPSDRRIGALGGAGSLATLFGLGGLLWWCWHQLRHGDEMSARGIQWVRIAAFCFTGAVLASYAKSALTSLPQTEASVADMGILRVAALLGIMLVANDGVPNPDRFMTLMRRLCLVAGLYATLGLIQFFSGLSIVDSIQIPGLSSTGVAGIDDRAGFARSEATAMHPLEYATVLAMTLPFCLTFAIYDRRRSVLIRWYPVAAITFSSVLSVTRSALIGVAAVFVVLFPTWPTAFRKGIAIMLGLALVVVYFAVPGMAGTIVGMFVGDDTSVSSRTGSYDAVLEFVSVSPFFGRGFGTFLPSYRILDNQYLVTLIEIGVVGLLAFLALLGMSLAVAMSARRHYREPVIRGMGMALVASMVAGGLLSAFYDSFAFPQACNMIFLISGMSGAYMNIRHLSDSAGSPDKSMAAS